MPLISDTIANLIGGVSQQAENLRFSNTANELKNAFASPVSGLQKRHAAEFVNELQLFNSTADLAIGSRAATHFINRDAVERYALVVDSAGLKAFDADTGDAIEVEYTGGSMPSYLTTDGAGGTLTDFANDLRFITVADTTFLLNRNVTAAGSTGSNFSDYHKAAFPQLEYDTQRGGSKGGRLVDDDIKTSGSSGYRTISISSGKSADTGDFALGYTTTTGSFMPLARIESAASAAISTDDVAADFVSDPVGHYALQNTSANIKTIKRYSGPLDPADTSTPRRIPFVRVGDTTFKYAPDASVGTSARTELTLQNFMVNLSGTGDSDAASQEAVFTGPYHLFEDIKQNGSTLTFRVVRPAAKTYAPGDAGQSATFTNYVRVNSAGKFEISDDNGSTYRAITVSHTDSTADVYLNGHTSSATEQNASASSHAWTTSGAFVEWNTATENLVKDITNMILDFANYTVGVTDEELRIIVADGAGFTLTKSAAGGVTAFEDLPPEAADGRVISVGGVGEGDGTYYVIGIDGEYVETYAVPYIIDDSTMPHVIKRKFRSDGTPYFELGQHQYAARVVGDEDSNRVPSFIGNKLNDIFVYKGRLGVLADENVIMTGANEFATTANFFRKSVIQLLDDDRIDIGMSTGRVDILKNAISFADTLMVMSDRAQFKLVSGTALSPNTVSIQQSTAFAVSPTVQPINAGNVIYFAQDNLNFTTVREMVAEYDTDIIETNEVTGQAPRYIPSGVFSMAVSTKKELLVSASSNEPNALYVYKYYRNESARLQSAWSKWTYNSDTRVVGFEFIDDYLVQILSVTTPDYVGSLELAAGATVPTHGTTSTRTYLVRTKIEEITSVSPTSFPMLLDFLVPRSKCVSVTGLRTDDTNASVTGLPLGTDSTTIELPYRTTSQKITALRSGSDDYGTAMVRIAVSNAKLNPLAGGTVAELTTRTNAFLAAPSATTAAAINAILDTTAKNTYLTVFGRHDTEQTDSLRQTFDVTDTPDFNVGIEYDFEFDLSPIYYKPGDSAVGRNDTRLQLRYATVTYDDSAGFAVEITPVGRTTKRLTFNSLTFGDSEDVLGLLSFETGAFRFPIMAKNDRVKIVFRNAQPYPSTLTTIEWEGFIAPKTLRG